MLPAHIAQNIRRQILYYLQSTFSFRDRKAERAFEGFLQDPEMGLFKGPWVQLRRPFRPAPDNIALPFDIDIPFHPFIHQYRAWRRLSAKDHPPQNTIITTGTGSGKTECFLFPILDHCAREKKLGKKGIKAIILYPMNALASDQEKRFVETILKDKGFLKTAGIRVGNYTGRYDATDPKGGKDTGYWEIGRDGEVYHGITNHETQQENPPDILLTNYRMLDFLLMRPQDQRLWRFNEPGILKYLVLDELHTYDGAQGADVACLIRRLKERLHIGKEELCVVGTSATLDDRDLSKDQKEDGTADMAEPGKERLARFAETLFEEHIPIENVLDEDRLAVEEIVHADLKDIDLPDPEQCHPWDDEDSTRYAIRQSQIWGGPVIEAAVIEGLRDDPNGYDSTIEQWELDLGEWLKFTYLFKVLLDVFHEAELQREDPLPWTVLVERLTRKEFTLQKVKSQADREILVASFCAMVAHAREQRSKMASVLVPTQVQLWVRELRRLGRVVSESPNFSWLDEPIPNTKSLPAFHCSECGESGWVAMHMPDMDAHINSKEVAGWAMESDPTKIYRGWFGFKDQNSAVSRKSQYIFVISPWKETESEADDTLKAPEERALFKRDEEKFYFCPESLVIRRGNGPCPLTGDPRRFRVKINNDTRQLEDGAVVGNQRCPHCGSVEGLFFIGAQGATLASVAIDEMFGSVLNNDPKLLAFTDSVQDASHRAGFFTARTYHFTFRTALQHVIRDNVQATGNLQGLKLTEVGQKLFDYWSQKKPGRQGSIKETMSVLMPPDLQEYPPFLSYRNDSGLDLPPSQLFEEIKTRLNWEATSEFGLMQTHGRTMELNGCACVRWDEQIIDSALEKLKERLPGINTDFEKIEESSLRIWLYGILHRYRERGALGHPYLVPFAKMNYWGKYPFGRAIPGRETYPPAIRYKPRLMVTAPQRNHEYVLAHTRGGQPPWHVAWAYRALKEPAVQEADILDLIAAMFKCGEEAGLFSKIHQDGKKAAYTISSEAAYLVPGGVNLVCDESDRFIVRPEPEADFWKNAPSMEYYAKKGKYRIQSFSPRQRYYQDRYNKGALRRVVAEEHTGLLATPERLAVERDFKKALHADDPNILACTSTLEMGIDIGDLSTTMLCSIPPNTASYLQRIGRAGRATGTALILSVINQQPHDLFFYARPMEMLKGKVEPPGCWLDASAVLARQYLGYCFDAGTRDGRLVEIPGSAAQLVEDLKNPDGHILSLMTWVTKNEAELQDRFLKRFIPPVKADTKARFLQETDTQLLIQKMHQAVNEFDRLYRDLENARKRLNDQLKKMDEEEKEARLEIQQELRILKGRVAGLKRTSALEIFTDFGLLPNYAFPERGVRFYGAVYNKHQQAQQDHRPVEIYRNATAALRELAPGSTFYTHRRQFDIQQIAIGNPQQMLTETWAICGSCGHMQRIEELNKPDAAPGCPQCGHSDDHRSLMDLGQQRQFIEFAQSQAISYMEHYESLSGDKHDERQRGFYDVILSFDQTKERSSGAVGDDELPFGVEYRSSMILREINAGYALDAKDVPFGPDTYVSDTGFMICRHCGVAIPPGKNPDTVKPTVHRRSCQSRRKYEKMRQEGKTGNPFEYIPLYLYRELRSEAVRLLLPLTDDEDLYTLVACIYLGLRLRFEGNPAHLIVQPQIMPDAGTGLTKHYLVIMDAVPGGTGFLKTLYQEKDGQDREGEGIMDLLRRARDTLETCKCRNLVQLGDKEDTDGCYRCIRSYHLQYKAEMISRERGIKLLNRLISAGEKRVTKGALDQIKAGSLFGSVLEKKFVEHLQAYVEQRNGRWESTIIKGNQGYRFILPESERIWELELQPELGSAQGVMVMCQPDFLLYTDDEEIKPIAVFTDGYEFHCYPNNRLADDMNKRRAILESGNYLVWSVTWDDLNSKGPDHNMVCPRPVENYLKESRGRMAVNNRNLPDVGKQVCNGMEQLKAFLSAPYKYGWQLMATLAIFFPLQLISQKRVVQGEDLQTAIDIWQTGSGMKNLEHHADGHWVYNDRTDLSGDFVSFITKAHAETNAREHVFIAGRLKDTEEVVSGSDFKVRWRRFLACMNFYQFIDGFVFFTSSEAENGDAPEITIAGKKEMTKEWQEVWEDTLTSLKPVVEKLAFADVQVPFVEYFDENLDEDAFAELAWHFPNRKIAVLAGDQVLLADLWRQNEWAVILPEDIEANGIEWLASQIKNEAEE